MWFWTILFGLLGIGIFAAFVGWLIGWIPNDPWGRFIPPLAATYLAAILGIPTGLLVDHCRQRREERRQQRIRDERLRNITEQLWKEVDDILKALEDYRKEIQKGKGFYELGFNVSTWDTLRHQFAELCPDPEYVRAFSLFYDEVHKLQRVLRLHRDLLLEPRSNPAQILHGDKLKEIALRQIEQILGFYAALLEDRRNKFEAGATH